MRPVLILFIATILIIAAKCIALSSINFDVDEVTTLMKPLVPVMGSSKVGFFTNEDVSTYNHEVYLEVKNVLVPNVDVEMTQLDTILLLENKQKKPLFPMADYRTLSESENSTHRAYILKRVK